MDLDKKGTILAIISASTFGTEAIIVKILYSLGINSQTLLVFRYLFAVCFIGLYLNFKKIKVNLPRKIIGKLLLFGLFLMPLPTMFLTYSFNYLSASVGIICLYCYPAFVTIWCTVFFKEKITLQKILSLTLAFLGIVLVIGFPAGALSVLGVTLALLAALANSFVVIVNSRVVKDINPQLAIFLYMTASTTVFIFIGLFSGKLEFHLQTVELLYLLLLAFLSTAIPQLTFITALKYTDASRVSITSMLEPVVTGILAVIVLKEALSLEQLLGVVLVLGGIWLLQHKTKTDNNDLNTPLSE